ncbi:hypothetical protein C0Q70_05574 [Pomacea canaliculata]|uniref:VWFA domain-containing protein n=1 Tax=Pomacea canaliculata TaxID=400727 RepID=A0A2T7PLJ4_POMCA|nr:hypothetical protein C0Q70_05574 [Pomacea canaliculata]
MTSVLCEETKLTHGLLENILKELQGQNLITYNRTYSIPDNKTLSEDCHYRDVGKKLAMCDPLEKYYRDGREFSTEQHSQNAESREVSATTVAVNQSLSENGAFESFQQSESILDSRETYGSHITDGVVNSLPTAQNNPLERGTGNKEGTSLKVASCAAPKGEDPLLSSKDPAEASIPEPSLQCYPLSSPRARSYDTVLCLDTSESMHEGGAFQQMVNIVNQFVDGVEDVVNESGSEENISVVTLEARPTLHSILPMIFLVSEMPLLIGFFFPERIEVGGSSPFYDAFLVALAALEKKGGIISLSGEYEIRPRIIFISDGHATGYEKHSAWDRPRDPANVRARLIRLLSDLKPSESSSLPHPIVFVPVGTKADRNFMSSLATLNGSTMVEPENITSLCRYFKIEEEVIEKVQLELEKSGQKKRSDGKPTDFYNVFEDTEGVMSGDRLPLGTRVTKGPDWTWGNQGGGGPGTVVQHENKKHPYTWVWWDTGEYNRYPYGPDMGFHIWKTEEYPRIKLMHDPLDIGMIVKKGHSLENLETIRNATKGVIIRRSQDRKRLKRLRKMWMQEEDDAMNGDKKRVWQWKDESGNWRLYPEDLAERIEKEFSRRHDGTLAFTRGGKKFVLNSFK